MWGGEGGPEGAKGRGCQPSGELWGPQSHSLTQGLADGSCSWQTKGVRAPGLPTRTGEGQAPMQSCRRWQAKRAVGLAALSARGTWEGANSAHHGQEKL